jgi:hypothetical protein
MEKLNVYQKIIEVKKTAKGFYRDSSSPGLKYKYVTGSQVLSKISEKMNEIGLLFLPVKVKHRSFDTVTIKYKSGEQMNFIVQAEVVYEWVNAENPMERVIIEFELYGQQDEASKAFGSGLTYTERYMLLKTLGLPTDEDDPDAKEDFNEKKNGTKQEEKKDVKNETKSETNGKFKDSKYKVISTLIKGSNFTIDDVSKYIEKKLGKSMPINELSDDIFDEMYNRLQSKINEERASVS